MPTLFEPMLAESRGEAFDDDRYLFEIKWDGTRAITYIYPDQSYRIRNRRGAWIESRYPELKEINQLPCDTVLDGEIVVLEDGRPNFYKLQQRDGLSDPLRIELSSQRLPAMLVLFDILQLNGETLVSLPLIERRERLKSLLNPFQFKHVLHSDYIIGQGKPYFEKIEQAQWEGVMAKRLEGQYLPGQRSANWLKIKVSHDEIFDLIGFVQREGDEAVSAIVVGDEQSGSWRYVAKVGSGFNEDERRALFKYLSQLPEQNYAVSDGPANCRWIAPRLRARIRFLEWTEDGRLRSPVFECFVNDST